MPALGYFYTLTVEEESSLATVLLILFVIFGKGFQVTSVIGATVSYSPYLKPQERSS